MIKLLRKKFILFAMSSVTVLLLVLIGAINILNWISLDKKSNSVLHIVAGENEKIFQSEKNRPKPFGEPINDDTLEAARFFTVHTDFDGNIIEVNTEKISSVEKEQAINYAKQVTKTVGRIGNYKYEVRRHGNGYTIFFMDMSSQISTFVSVLGISSAIAVTCWFLMLLFTFLLSDKAVRPIVSGIEKQKQFITDAGHELKTPLAIISTNNDASALIYGETKYTANIRNQIKRLNSLMSNLLILAKLDEKHKTENEKLNVSEIFYTAFLSYEETFAKKNITLKANIPENIYLYAPKNIFEQIFSAIADNAAKYTPENGLIYISLSFDGSSVRIEEENTCDCFPCENPERLFERFYRGDSARTQNGNSGYGIGLSAARSAAEISGGKLTAEFLKNGENKTVKFTAVFSSRFTK